MDVLNKPGGRSTHPFPLHEPPFLWLFPFTVLLTVLEFFLFCFVLFFLQLDVAMSDHTDHMDHMSNPTPALNPSFLGVHAILMTISLFVLLPLGIRWIRMRSPLHKPCQLICVCLMTIAVIFGSLLHSHPHSHHASGRDLLVRFHGIMGWILLAWLWIQVVLGWISSSWVKVCLCVSLHRIQHIQSQLRNIHRALGILVLPFLLVQWISGVYHALGIDSSAEYQQMLAHTGIGGAFIVMGVFYLYKGWLQDQDQKDRSLFRIESFMMLAGGFALTLGELIAQKDVLSFFKNEHILTGFFWVMCGFLGYILLSGGSWSSMVPVVPVVPVVAGPKPEPEPEPEQTTDIKSTTTASTTTVEFSMEESTSQQIVQSWIPMQPSSTVVNNKENKQLRANIISPILVVTGHIVFIGMHHQHLENMTFLHFVHAFFLALGLLFRMNGDLHVVGCCLVMSGTSFLCAQSGICLLAIQAGIKTANFVMMVLITGVSVIMLSHWYLYCWYRPSLVRK